MDQWAQGDQWGISPEHTRGMARRLNNKGETATPYGSYMDGNDHRRAEWMGTYMHETLKDEWAHQDVVAET